MTATFRYSSALFILLVASSSALDFLAGGAESWYVPERVKRCPVHQKLQMSPGPDGKGVEFALPAYQGGRGGRFSLVQVKAPSAVSSSFAGLRVTFSSAGGKPGPWKLRVNDGRNSRARHVAAIDNPGGNITVFVPWKAFRGEELQGKHFYECKERDDCFRVRPDDITDLGMVIPILECEPNTLQTFTLHELVAVPLPSVLESKQKGTDYRTVIELDKAGNLAATCLCDVGCARCEIERNLHSAACTSSHYANLCMASWQGLTQRLHTGLTPSAGCGSNATSSGAALRLTQALDLAMSMSNCLPGQAHATLQVTQDLLNGLFLDSEVFGEPACEVKSARNLTGFAGPFSGMGISGYNDLKIIHDMTVEECLDHCRAEPRCKSVDYGARGSALGGCFLSTANRASAGSQYTEWQNYEYYEVGSASSGADPTTARAAVEAMEKNRLTELVATLGLQDTDCCDQPQLCISKAIETGAPLYNSGDQAGCFFVYHSVAAKIGACPAADEGTFDYVSLMKSAAISAEADSSANLGSWQLRRAFDIVRHMATSATCGLVVGSRLGATVSSEASVSTASGSMAGVVGPVVGMGISGHNDLGMIPNTTPERCLELCRAKARCRSMDYGARGGVKGDCWLSTADRASVGGAYESWAGYDYYELLLDGEDRDRRYEDALSEGATSHAPGVYTPVAQYILGALFTVVWGINIYVA